MIVLITAGLALMAFVIAGEGIVRAWIRFAPQDERLDYADVRDGMLLRPGFSGEVVSGDGGTVAWTNNAAGFRATRDYAPKPPPGTLRIMSIGDSFTAGYRVGDEETFSRRLEVWLNDTLGPTEVLVAGVEDPNHGLEYFRQTGIEWAPHVVLFGITLGNDIAQSYVARHPTTIGFGHGLENLTFPPEAFEPWSWSNVFGRALFRATLRSRLFALLRPRRAIDTWYGHNEPPRIFDPVNGLGMFLADPPEEINVAFERMFQVLRELDSFTEEQGITLVVGVFPQPYQVQAEDWVYARFAYGLRTAAFDLDGPNDRIRAFCVENALTCIDPTEFMQRVHEDTGDRLYFPQGDMHWNARGHEVWLDGTRDRLLEITAPLADRLGVSQD